MINKIILWVFFIVQFQVVWSQTISGYVYDDKTNEALETVAVYFDNTTVGTTTNSDGFFTIDYSDAIQSNLVISFLGYEKIYLSDYRDLQDITVRLKESIDTLDPVYLDFDDGLTRKQKLKIFRNEFLGYSKIAKSCKIRNEEDIYLFYDNERKTLIARAYDLIIVDNKALNYQINYDMIQFEVVLSYLNKETTEYSMNSVSYAGTSFFSDFKDKTSNRVYKKRDEAYYGSVQHFIRALYKEDLKSEGFDVYKRGLLANPRRLFTVTSIKGKNVKKVTLNSRISIVYDKKYQSELRIINAEIFIDQYGNFSPTDGLYFSGNLGDQRIGDTLPLDYEPKE